VWDLIDGMLQEYYGTKKAGYLPDFSAKFNSNFTLSSALLLFFGDAVREQSGRSIVFIHRN
jgi:hypothetical protein